MVTLRDGKSTDDGRGPAATPERPRRSSRRASTARQSAGPSDLSVDEPLLTDSEPATPQSALRRKRVRAADVAQHLQPLTEAEEQQDDTARDQAALLAAADMDLPSPTSTPSPLQKKARPGTPQPSKAAKKPKQQPARRGSTGLMAAAVVLLLAVAGAALWPRYGDKYPTIVPEGGLAGLTWGWGSQENLQNPTAWAPEVLAGILPEGQTWAELAGDISERLRTPAAARSHKATALILACGSAEDCAEAAAALAVLPPRGEACSLALNASRLAGSDQPAAALQASLAPFLRRCPAGLVLLQDAQQLPVAAVPALQNGLSELGGFQHDGFVDGSKAAYALLLQLPAQDVMAATSAADAAAASASIKETFFYLQQQLLEEQQQEEEQSPELEQALGVASRALKALHRRIDFAAPVKLGTATEEALDQYLAAQKSSAAAAAAAATQAEAAARAAAEAGFETASEGEDDEEGSAPAVGGPAA
ncbi:hypothetical protein OEZ85_004020 [Tetradesmus obliquus]|uniref:Uncharacterized protein n=1 Tax=Tetradesmus obliquus TaxID=3088 RepID=A0ABY8UDZ9_TETOB|nr:hypothetical protein OEZ85_004020 [Tetradesmus obliquus]